MDAPIEYEVALDKALTWLGHRSHSEQELIGRLTRAGAGAEVAERVVERLSQLGLINDTQLALDHAEYAALVRGESDAAVESRLRKRGIARPAVTSAVRGLLTPETERALALARRRAGLAKHLEPEKALRRTIGHLISKGYEPDTALAAARAALEEVGLRTEVPID